MEDKELKEVLELEYNICERNINLIKADRLSAKKRDDEQLLTSLRKNQRRNENKGHALKTLIKLL